MTAKKDKILIIIITTNKYLNPNKIKITAILNKLKLIIIEKMFQTKLYL